MKRWMKRAAAMALAVTMALGCCISASAADEDPNRVYVVEVAEGYTLTPLDASGEEITETPEEADGEIRDVYKGVAKLKLSFSGDSNVQYVVFLLSGDSTVPTESNIRYINQQTGGTTVEFTIYPDDLTQPGTYTVQLSDSDSYTQVASLTVAEPPYTLGDVNEDGNVTAYDASLVLQHAAGSIASPLTSTQLAAADTNGDGNVTAYDASLILQFAAGKITEF